MNFLDKQIMTLFSLDLFKQMSNNEKITPYKFNIFTSLLVEHNIPFDVSYSPGTRRDTPSLELTIYINPTTTLVFTVTPENGTTSN